MPRRASLRTLAAGLALIGFGTNVGAAVAVRAPEVGAPLQPDASRERRIYAFRGSPDGAWPFGDLLADKTGALYGTTLFGGGAANCIPGCGTVFKVTPSASGHYTERVLYKFQGGSDGASPTAGLIADAKGALYGTTYDGGKSNSGTVFKLTPSGSGYSERVLHAFQGGADGSRPWASLIADATGALFGTTTSGGAGACSSDGYSGCGTVFKLTPSHAGYTESVLYRFAFSASNQDGVAPEGGLLAGKNGALFGTTSMGGACCGTVFELLPTGNTYTESVLYRFTGLDGATPQAGLIVDTAGALYGTTTDGGGRTAQCATGCGTVFKLAPSASGYTESVLYRFGAFKADGQFPFSGLLADKSGALYGTTYAGGGGPPSVSDGTVFKLTPSGTGYAERVLYRFRGGNDGISPQAGVTADRKGVLFGVTTGGGANADGIVFKLKP